MRGLISIGCTLALLGLVFLAIELGDRKADEAFVRGVHSARAQDLRVLSDWTLECSQDARRGLRPYASCDDRYDAFWAVALAEAPKDPF